MKRELLLKLLASCSKGEKRYISVFIGNNNPKLLNAYKKMLESKQISTRYVEYLTRLVTRALIQYNMPLNKPMTDREKEDMVILLQEKGLYSEAIVLLDELIHKYIAKKDYTKVSYLLNLKINMRLLSGSSQQDVSEIIKLRKEKKEYLSKEKRIDEYRLLMDNLRAFSRETGFPRTSKDKEKLITLIQHPLLKELRDEDIRATLMFYNIKGVIYLFLGNLIKAKTNFKKVINLLQNTQDLPLEVKNTNILYAKIDYLNVLYYERNNENFIKTSQEILNLIEENPYLIDTGGIGAFISIFIAFGIKTGDITFFKKISETFSTSKINVLLTKLDNIYAFEILASLCILFFLMNKKDETLFLLNTLKSIKKTNIRKDLKLLYYVLLLMIFTEENDWKFLNSFINRFSYHLNKTDPTNYPLENTLLEFLKKYVKTKENPKKLEIIIKNTSEKVKQIMKKYNVEYTFLSIIPFNLWFEVRKQNSSYMNLIKKRKNFNNKLLTNFINLTNRFIQ